MVTTKNEILCPYCSKKIDKEIKRKTNCPICQKIICVRKGNLVTEEEAKIIDWIFRLEGSLRLSRSIFNDEREKLSRRFGFKAPVDDTIWAFLNKKVAENDSFEQKIAYYEMGRIVSLEGKDSKPYIAEALKTTLFEYKKLGLSRVKILGCGNRCDDDYMCDSCKENCGRIITIEEALKTMPIPTQCTNSECRCSYEIISEDLSDFSRLEKMNKP